MAKTTDAVFFISDLHFLYDIRLFCASIVQKYTGRINRTELLFLSGRQERTVEFLPPGAEPGPFLLVKRRKLLDFHRSMMILIRFRKVSGAHCGAFHTEFRLKPIHSENTGSNPVKRTAE